MGVHRGSLRHDSVEYTRHERPRRHHPRRRGEQVAAGTVLVIVGIWLLTIQPRARFAA
jgi:hypothetical protein